MKQTLKNALKPLYKGLLESVKGRNEDLCTFVAQWGDAYKNDGKGIMFYGRATNGWISNCRDIEVLFDENNERGVFARRDQMKWVNDCWDNVSAHQYQSNSSAFWRVIRKVSEHLYGSSEWYRHIVWSDVCKVAPQEAGNPSDGLYNLQLGDCQQIMAKEIEVFNPKHVVLFTGYSWAKDFLSYLNHNTEPTMITSKDWDRYQVKVYKIGSIFFYVSEHPQTKPEGSHIEALISLIEANK